ncbi:MAG: LapA family protein [Phyllobacteriaceae bacterium]|nr:LapA family protein [Phyllobacteriaceae bacterium]
MRRIFQVLVTIPVAIILIALSVANRAPVALTLDPFNPGNAGLTLALPLFVIILGAMMVGAVIGSVLTWLSQGKHRAKARSEASRASLIAREAEALKTERAAMLQDASALPAPR